MLLLLQNHAITVFGIFQPRPQGHLRLSEAGDEVGYFQFMVAKSLGTKLIHKLNQLK